MYNRNAWVLGLLGLAACAGEMDGAEQVSASIAGHEKVASSSYAYRYDIELVDLEHKPLNDHDGPGAVVRFSDLSAPQERDGVFTSWEKRWDHTHAYLAASVFDANRGAFATTPYAFDDGAENYFGTYRWNAALRRYAGQRVEREARGHNRYTQPRPLTPFAVNGVLVRNHSSHRLTISVVADARTDWSTRDALSGRERDQLCYVQQRNERAARSGPSRGDLPALEPTDGCAPIWTVRPGPGGLAQRRYGELPATGCDGYVAAADVVLDGAELARRTAASGVIELDLEHNTQPSTGCNVWYEGTSPLHESTGVENFATRTHVRLRIRRTVSFDPSFPPPSPAGDCTLRPMAELTAQQLDRYHRQWRSEDQRVDGTFTRAQNDSALFSGTSAEASGQGAQPGAALRLLDVPLYTDEMYTTYGPFGLAHGRTHAGDYTHPYSPLCSRFVNVPDAQEAADQDLREKAQGIPLSNGGLLLLYGEYDAQGTFVMGRIRHLRADVFGDWTQDHVLFPYNPPPR